MEPRRAAELLDAHDQVAARAQNSGAPREAALFSFWTSIAFAAYLACILLTGFGPRTETPPVYFAVFASIVIGTLMNGAFERLGIRVRARMATTFLCAIALAMFVALLGLDIADISFPLWLCLGPSTFMLLNAFAADLPRIRRTAGGTESVWTTPPLSIPSRVITIGIGIVLGAMIILEAYGSAAEILGLGAMMIVLFLMPTSFDIRRVGSEWRRIQWIAIAVASLALGLFLVMDAWTPVATPVMGASVGLVVAGVMSASALITVRNR